MIALGAIYLTVAPSPDQALFDYIAWSHLQGDRYYVGVVEQNWPGKMILHELGIRLFGAQFWTFRAVDFLLLLIISGAGALFLRRAGFARGAWVFMWLYPALYVTSGAWLAGQRDIIAAGILLCSAALSLDRVRMGALCAAGILVGIAVLIRPTYLSYVVGLMILQGLRFPAEAQITLRQTLTGILALLAGFLTVITGTVLAGWSIGALDDFYQQTFLFNIESYQAAEPRSRLFGPLVEIITGDWHWISVLAAIGFALWLIERSARRAFILILGIAATTLVSYFAQNKGFGYHLGGLLTVLTALAAVALDRLILWRNRTRAALPRAMTTGVLAFCVLLCAAGTLAKLENYRANAVVLSGTLKPLGAANCNGDWDSMLRAAAFIRDNSTSDDFVLQWGRNFAIPYLAQRRSTLRFVSTPALVIMTPSFSGYDTWLAEIGQSFRDRPPRFAVLDRTIMPLDAVSPRVEAKEAEQRVMAALSAYEPVLSNDCFSVLQAPL